MRQLATAAEGGQVVPLFPQTVLDTEERLFRRAYGMGADATQLEARHRPFLTEDEAWAAYLAERAS